MVKLERTPDACKLKQLTAQVEVVAMLMVEVKKQNNVSCKPNPIVPRCLPACLRGVLSYHRIVVSYCRIVTGKFNMKHIERELGVIDVKKKSHFEEDGDSYTGAGPSTGIIAFTKKAKVKGVSTILNKVNTYL